MNKRIKELQMGIQSHHLLRKALAPLPAEERQKRNLLPEQVAMACDLSVENINLIEAGAPVTIKKYRRLLYYYNKKIKITLVDNKAAKSEEQPKRTKKRPNGVRE